MHVRLSRSKFEAAEAQSMANCGGAIATLNDHTPQFTIKIPELPKEETEG